MPAKVESTSIINTKCSLQINHVIQGFNRWRERSASVHLANTSAI